MPIRRFVLAALMLFAGSLAARAQTNEPSFSLVNRSGRVIHEAYVSPSSDTRWGQDRLGRAVLPNGQSFQVRLPAGNCAYDIRVVYDRAGGPSEERRNVNTCTERDVIFTGQQARGPQQTPPPQGQPPGAGGGNPSFNLVNNSDRVVRELFASLTTERNWGPNRLAGQTVAPGAFFGVRLPQGECLYDLRVVYDSGEPQERRRVNLCEITNLTVPLP